mmetsp:Transcript_18657/g.16520  ORF Transcript_18657/g.16520 Transcript_18657/m.16520 type:complete len:90 (-) Transcript_18657:34-303(-)
MSSRPTQNGVTWMTNSEGNEYESSDSKKYENPIDVEKANTNYQTPEKRQNHVDDTLTMHTADLMSILKSSVIKPANESLIPSGKMQRRS